jgi:hypothetical protein
MQEVTSTTTQRLPIEFDLAGAELGGRLEITTQIVVVRPDPEDELGASMRGTVIWRQRHRVLLEGDAAQFPTETADLAVPPHNMHRAGWLLDVEAADLDMNAGAAVRLIINESHPLMRRVLDGDASPDAVVALEVMRWDVARQLIDIALDTPEFLERDEAFEEDSFGWLLNAVITTHFPGENPRSLHAMRERERGRYETMLQDQARILG